ncbi:unannotated protein [freshwater metagenome]|uniref:Unannotated protein n=1 Tax=freshwater metagenome TaxID=449393 RepID=A0A6J7L6X1_9ZZZZ
MLCAVRGLERDVLIGAQAQHRPPRHTARQVRRVGGTGDIERISSILQAQREAQVGVRTHIVADHTLRSLCRQQQVHTQTASALCHSDECMQERRLFGHEGRELVDHHHQTREHHLGVGRPQRGKVGGTVRSQQCLAPT